MKISAFLRSSNAVVWIPLLCCASLVLDAICGGQPAETVSVARQQRLELPFAKNKGNLLQELRKSPKGWSESQAIADFDSGLAALADEQYSTAQKAFNSSFESAPTYAAVFNRALTEQLMADFEQAERDYLQAQSMRQNDPELLCNLAGVYERLGQWDRALQMFGGALQMTRSQKEPLLEGRVALQFALAQYEFGEVDTATRTLEEADTAFARINATVAREVVAAKRANILIKTTHPKEGAQLFLDAIARLNAVGAQYEEANARIDLSGYYLDSNQLANSLSQLSVSVALCERLGETDLLGRSLNNRGIYHLRSLKPALAEADFKSALAKFKEVSDWTGQGEALNNLAALAAQTKNVDLAADYLRDAARAYQRAGRYGHAFDKLLALAKAFDQSERFEEAAEAFTAAAELNSKLQNSQFSRLGLAIARHDFKSQHFDEAEIQIAVLQASCSKVQDTDCLTQAAVLAQQVRIAYWLRILRWIGIAGLLTWLIVELYRHRRKFPQVARVMVPIATVFVFPVRALHRGYLRFREVLEGPLARALSPEEAVYFGKVENVRRWLLRISMAVITLFAAAVSFALVTRPELDQISEARTALASWPLPWKLQNSISTELSQLRGYVLASFLLQVLLFLCWLLIGWVIFDLLDVTIRRVLRRVSNPDLDLTAKEWLDLVRRARHVRVVHALILTPGVILFAFLFHQANEAGSPIVPAVVLLGAILLAEAWQLWQFARLVRTTKLPSVEAGFNWIIRRGWRDFFAVFADLLVFVNLLAPMFYTATLAIQKFFIYPGIKKVSLDYSAQILSAVRSFHSVTLPSTFGLTIPAFDDAYRPTTGLGAMWKQSVPALMSYAIPILLILMLFRLAIPWSLSFNRGPVFKRILVSFILTEALVKSFEFASERLLGVSEEHSLILHVGVVLLGIIFAILADQTLREQKVICPHCGRSNREEASFCNWCGKPL